MVGAAEQRQEAHDLAHRLLDALRPEDRTIMILKETEELSVSEIAQTMGWSEAKVKIRAFRARQVMRKHAERILAARRAQAVR
jgi:RNA polymerase sigma-70 factor (ECF subfamily)